jgi:hypothetical protein
MKRRNVSFLKLCAIKQASFRFPNDVIRYCLLSAVASVHDAEPDMNRLTLFSFLEIRKVRSIHSDTFNSAIDNLCSQ